MNPEDRRPKQTAFRLPQRTLDILDKIVEEGKARTRTDALILVVDMANTTHSENDIQNAAKMDEYERRITELESSMETYKMFRNTMDTLIEKMADDPELWEFYRTHMVKGSVSKQNE